MMHEDSPPENLRAPSQCTVEVTPSYIGVDDFAALAQLLTGQGLSQSAAASGDDRHGITYREHIVLRLQRLRNECGMMNL